MNYKVLYRKYRPSDFSNIVDQEYITTILKNSIKNDKISHAYIFSGPRGTGKTTTAKVFAKAINCENMTESGPCNECESCKNFNNNPDVIELDAASNNGVDEIREIIDNVRISPSYSKYKVYIIDEVHMLTTNAFNALLLTLEEPPKNVIFILATTNIENVPITILSRCQRFDFKKISNEAMVKRLRYVCNEENINASDNSLLSIAKLADGGLRDALSILDQLRSENNSIDEENINNIFGVVPTDIINKVINNFVNKDVQSLLESINDLKSKDYNYKHLVKNTIIILREYSLNAILDKDYALYEKLKNIILDLNKSLNEVNVYINPMILFETSFLSNLYETSDFHIASESCFKDKNTNLEAKVINNDVSHEKIKEKNYFPGNNFDDDLYSTFVKNRVNNCFVCPKKTILESIKKQWGRFIDSIYDNNVLSMIVDVLPVCASDDYLILSSNSIGNAELINLNSLKIENILNQFLNKNYKIVVLASNEWQKYKDCYIKDLKNGIEYKLMDDVSLNKEDTKSNNDIINIAGEVFNSDKIEYE